MIITILLGLITGWRSARDGNKTQQIRTLDVVLLGPFLIYAATLNTPSQMVKLALAFSGAATITFNLRNLNNAPVNN